MVAAGHMSDTRQVKVTFITVQNTWFCRGCHSTFDCALCFLYHSLTDRNCGFIMRLQRELAQRRFFDIRAAGQAFCKLLK